VCATGQTKRRFNSQERSVISAAEKQVILAEVRKDVSTLSEREFAKFGKNKVNCFVDKIDASFDSIFQVDDIYSSILFFGGNLAYLDLDGRFVLRNSDDYAIVQKYNMVAKAVSMSSKMNCLLEWIRKS
jgi:NADH/NAD ratio-sensing transcriptional regulator Rex